MMSPTTSGAAGRADGELLPAMLRVTAPLPALTAVAPLTIAGAFWVACPLPALVLDQ